MKMRKIFAVMLLAATAMGVNSCSDDDDNTVDNGMRTGNATKIELTKDAVPVSALQFSIGRGSAIIGIESDGNWTAEVDDTTWVKLAVHAGYGYTNKLSYTKLDVLKNEGEQNRSTTLTVKSGSLTKTLVINQNGMGLDPNDPFISAFTFVERMGLGYNLGNTLDSNPLGSWWDPEDKTPYDFETQWGQPETTQEIIDFIAERGFKTIRVPVTWGIHCNSNGTIRKDWMNRVEEVVKMVLDAGCYCILNIQHDSGDAENAWLRADMDNYEAISAQMKSLWTQIAERFRDYDERLVFEAFNEILSASGEWGDPADDACYTAVNKLEQDFVDVVRATGGNNEYRNLMVNPYGSGSSAAKLAAMEIPKDIHPNHIMASIHSYDPYWFCNDTSDKDAQQWYIYMFDTTCQQEIDDIFMRIEKRFSGELGVPYIIGEFGAIGKHPAMAERVKYAQYMVQKFKQYNTTGLWWMGLCDRDELEWTEPNIVDALFGNSQ
ncbi:MAG: cellulase family glycosylhydrolase [Prevotella sp.]|nr:cellulase family glycosylhydrolase [Prevotella sp.]